MEYALNFFVTPEQTKTDCSINPVFKNSFGSERESVFLERASYQNKEKAKSATRAIAVMLLWNTHFYTDDQAIHPKVWFTVIIRWAQDLGGRKASSWDGFEWKCEDMALSQFQCKTAS